VGVKKFTESRSSFSVASLQSDVYNSITGVTMRRRPAKRSKPKKTRLKRSKKSPSFFKKIKKILRKKVSNKSYNLLKEKELSDSPKHGESKTVLMVRDPWWLFAYWDLKDCSHGGYKVLRVYDVTGLSLPSSRSHFDMGVGNSNAWYIDTGTPDREWQVEIGFKNSQDVFLPLSRSNRVRTPRHGVSELIDEEWSLPDKDFWKILGLSTAGQESSLSLFQKSSR
jgi:hypothetical protein